MIRPPRRALPGFVAAVEGRHSVRRFTAEPVPRDDVREMVRLATLAANAGNAQPWRFVAVDDPALLAAMRRRRRGAHRRDGRLARSRGGRSCARDAQHARLLHASSPRRRWRSPCCGLPYESASDRALALRGVSRDEHDRLRARPDLQSVGAAVQVLVTAAHALGYGACWLSAPVLAAPRLEELLGVDEPARLVAIVAVGRAGRSRASRRRACALDRGLAFRAARTPTRTHDDPRPAARRPRRDHRARPGRRGAHDRRDRDACSPIDDPAAAAPLYAAAAELRRRHFGDAVFLYGFVYFSTWCRNDCTFCLYRRGQRESPRYRKSLDEVVAISVGLAASGVHLIDLTMGEDPLYFAHGEFDALVELVERRQGGHRAAGHGVARRGAAPTCSPPCAGVGAEWYACYQEIHDREALRAAAHRPGLRRARARRAPTPPPWACSSRTACCWAWARPSPSARSPWPPCATQRLAQVRVMTFVPQRGTPLAHRTPAGRIGELVTIATLRLAMPDRLIPASLDVDGIAGLEPRIAAGANVVTSLVPPDTGLAGVSQSELDIDEGLRTAPEVAARLEALGLRVATAAEYADWVGRRAPARAATRPAPAASPASA